MRAYQCSHIDNVQGYQSIKSVSVVYVVLNQRQFFLIVDINRV